MSEGAGTADVRPSSRAARAGRLAAIGLVALIAVLTVLASNIAQAAPAPAPDRPIPEVPEIDPIQAPDIDTDADTTRPEIPGPILPTPPTPSQFDDEEDGTGTATIGLEVPDLGEDSSNAVVIILLLSVLSIAPSLLIMMTSFTRIVIVMSLTRNALGIPQLPPQQVIVGLSIFLSLFVMGPTLAEMNEVALQPLMNNEIDFTEAAEAASQPIREFMLQYTREGELELFLDASQTETPVTRDEVPLVALIPAFVLSELKSAFILGFIIFVPFMVLDLVVSAVLTSLGMMMLPPTFVSLPLKLLLFILLDGWTLVVGTLLSSYG